MATWKWNPHERHTCGDCGALEGEIHQRGCDMERCPFCGGQLITCECCYEKLGIDASPGTWAYDNGLTETHRKLWDRMLEPRRIPYVVAPNLCVRCGELWPDMFMVEDWNDVIPASLRREILCRPCYETIKAFVLEARKGDGEH